MALVEFEKKAKISGRLSKEIKAEDISICLLLRCSVIKLLNDRMTYELKKA
jgi:hypothetical protein